MIHRLAFECRAGWPTGSEPPPRQSLRPLDQPCGPSMGRSMTGLTLIEALLASLLLSTGMVLLLKGQAALREYGDHARERAAAAVLAEAQVERLRAGLPDDDGP